VLRRARVLPLSHPNGPNLEQLVNQRPQLVFTSSQWRKGTQAMRNLGMRVVETEPRSFGQVYAQTRRIARIIGRRAAGNRFVRRMILANRRATAGIRKRPRVMVILGVGRTPFTFLKNSWGGQIVRAAGGNMVTGGASGQGGFARISDEVVVAEAPEVIIAVPHANTNNIPELVEYMKNNEAWGSTPAALNNRIYVSTDNSLLQAGTDMARTIRVVRKAYLRN
jgi:iron complex transport system substrate-binding protein